MDGISDKLRSLPARWKMVWPLAKNDFKSKYATSQLGMFWAFFRPVVMACVYIFVFSLIGRAAPVGNVYPYALWMLPGLIVWFAFSDSVSSGTQTLTEYSYLVKNIKFNISVLPDVKVISAFIVHCFFTVLIFLIYLIAGLPVKIFILQLPYYMLAAFIFSLTIARITAAIHPFFKDLSALVEILLLVGIWACPIMWSLDMLPVKYHWLFQLNPLYYLVTGYRESFMGDLWFWNHPLHLAGFWIFTLLLDFGSRKMFNRLSIHFADVI